MKIRMFDLAAAEPSIRFSPYCWRSKMAMTHKDVAFETMPWRFTEKPRLEPSGQDRVPVIIHDDRWVSDSWTIALYLDACFPDQPALMKDDSARAAARFVMSWCDMTLNPAIARYAILDIFNAVHADDQPYFRKSREARFGMTLEECCADRDANRRQVAAALAPMEQTLRDTPYLGGAELTYADFALFGSLMWPHVVCKEPVLDKSTKVAAWFERMLDLHGGYARAAPTVVD